TRERCLLARAYANLAIDAQPLGDVSAHAEHLHDRAVLDHDGHACFEPALLALGSSRQAVFEATRLARLQALGAGAEHTCRMLRCKVRPRDAPPPAARPLGTPVKITKLGRPRQLPGAQVP